MAGKCLCGAVEYELDPPITSVTHCHCESCRRAHGAAFVTWATVPRAQLRMVSGAGRLVAHRSSPGAWRSFCGRCGSQMWMNYDDEPKVTYLALASLTTPADRSPDRHVSFEERVPWFPFSDTLPKHVAKSSEIAE